MFFLQKCQKIHFDQKKIANLVAKYYKSLAKIPVRQKAFFRCFEKALF